MPLQPDLLATSLDDVQPEAGRTEPRLWVRRMVIWSAPGEIIREVSLRPGFNIIWSPDSGKAGEPMGHGGGKTSFCRLIRYCLGEDSFGSQVQRQMIANKLPDGHVGAEIILDGAQWIVVRPVGIGRSHHCGINDDLDHAFTTGMLNTGLSPLRQAITKAVMAQAASHMPVANQSEDGWEAALAWLTRDQECRLRDALEWRAAQTQSQSPSRQLSEADRLVIVRLLINALKPEELKSAEEYRKLTRQIEDAKKRRQRLEWLVSDLQSGLEQEFGEMPDNNPAQIELWTERAATNLAAAEAEFDGDIVAKLSQARKDGAELEIALRDADVEIGKIDGRLAERIEQKRLLENDGAKAHTHVFDAENPICKECGQSLNPNAVEFVKERQQERDAVAKDAREAVEDVTGLNSDKEALLFKRATTEQALTPLALRVTQLEESLVKQSQQLSQAKGHVTMTTRFVQHSDELTGSDATMDELVTLQSAEFGKITELRRASADAIARLSQHFDAILRYLVPENMKGDISLDQKGLHLRPQMSGDLTTAAIDSLKIVAFDIAVLLLTIEGRTQLPAFLIHDSPREADLGLSIYNRLFTLAEKIEGFGQSPTFQYIMTTTTAPPEEFRKEPWKRLELHGAPPDQRLFKADL